MLNVLKRACEQLVLSCGAVGVVVARPMPKCMHAYMHVCVPLPSQIAGRGAVARVVVGHNLNAILCTRTVTRRLFQSNAVGVTSQRPLLHCSGVGAEWLPRPRMPFECGKGEEWAGHKSPPCVCF
jgi:hypothetical protein